MASDPRWSPVRATSPGRGDEGPVKFSDSRFLQQVLLEAQRNGSDAPSRSMQRLEGMGFGPDVVKVALHVAGGDEHKALQLCMSGLSFVGAGSGSDVQSCAPPAPLRCYVCGQKYLTDKSLEIHLKACKKRFQLQEAKRPAGEQRPLLDESDLPEGVECLESHYEATQGLSLQKTTAGFATSFEDWVETRRPAPDPTKLLPCEFCKRTFQPDRLVTHQKVCLQRPKPSPSPMPRRRSPASPSSPPIAAVNAYSAFCNQLERCRGCARQFRPELLPAHEKACFGKAKKPQRRSTSTGAASPAAAAWGSGKPSPAARSTTPTGVRRSVGGNSPLSFTPPGRVASAGTSPTAARTAASPVPSWGTVGSSPSSRYAAAGNSQEAALPSSAALLEKGLLADAEDADQERLRAQLAARLPGAELAGVFRIENAVQTAVYEALKSTMQQQRKDGQAPLEQELWHGTSWTFVTKILKQGFNRSFAGRHGTLLGNATYFSTDPAYSMRFCDKKGGGKDSTKALIVSRVLVGSYCKGCPSDVEPPVVDAETGDRYDSTVDNMDAPSIFAVFRDFQALPLFLVEVDCRNR
eukprot:TRINITY_DN19822_c0_g1_i1.p1 TRINITY_DN19822_c0_g1~~TRINITY_DN19822_c0_g1_i1.p1  ORF type:complete len:579 (-),score=108.18 TRINITY_DN19822_c0_g1_i1:24-1760(-)